MSTKQHDSDDVFVLSDGDGVDGGSDIVVQDRALFLQKFHRYAIDRLAAGNGADRLQAHGFNEATFLRTYEVGYVPKNFSDLLNSDDQERMPKHIHGDALVIPRYDESAHMVDLACYNFDSQELQSDEIGSYAPRLSSAYDELLYAETLEEVVQAFADGQHNTLLVDDVSIYSAEPATSHSDVITCTYMDTMRGQYHFTSRELEYRIDKSWEGGSLVTIRVLGGDKEQSDKFDIGIEKQVNRFVRAIAKRFKLDQAVLTAHMQAIADKLDLQLAVAEQLIDDTAMTIALPTCNPKPVQPSVSDCLLQRTDLIQQFQKDMQHCLWIGDEDIKTLSLLCLVSRHLNKPAWLQLRGASIATATPLQILAQICPANGLLHVSKISESSLYHGDAESLKNKALVIDHAGHLRSEAQLSLRILAERGSLTFQQAERDVLSGRMRVTSGEARGPITCLCATERETGLDQYMIIAKPDESAEQTERIIAAQLAQYSNVNFEDRHALIMRRWQQVLETISTAPTFQVHIPFVDRIQFPASKLQHRRELGHFLTLIKASALLHYQQREVIDGKIIATETDFQSAAQAAERFLGRERSVIGPDAQRIIDGLWAQQAADAIDTWSTKELKTFCTELFPSMTRYAREQAWKQLAEAGYLEITGTGRGRQGKTFALLLTRAQAQMQERAISLIAEELPTGSAINSAIYLPFVS